MSFFMFFGFYFNDPTKLDSCLIFWSEFRYFSEITDNVKAVSVLIAEIWALQNV